MQTLSAKKHQELMTAKWHKKCEEWKPEVSNFPQLAMFGFHRNYGYVTFDERKSCWRRTRKESIEAFLRWK
jgi:hypothetical protein